MSSPHAVPGPVALVTGASSGIGRALATRLGGQGYGVALVARRETPLREAAAEVDRAGGRALPLVCDVADAAALRNAVARCREALGPVDLLVANAGIGGPRHIAIPAPEVERVLDINLRGAVTAVDAVLPDMLDRRSGHLVAISSLAGYAGLPGAAPYAASKAAMTTYFESLRIELRGTGVDVTVIAPGWVRTPLIGGARRPFLMELDPAADRILNAIRRRRRHYAFPWQVATMVRLGRLMPRSLYDRLVSAVIPVPAADGSPSGGEWLSPDRGST